MDLYPVWNAEASDHFWTAIKSAREADITEPVVDMARLSTEAKRRVWQHLKAHYPEYADVLQSSTVQYMREHFDARVHLRKSIVEEALNGYHD